MRSITVFYIGLLALWVVLIPRSGISQVPRTRTDGSLQPAQQWSNAANVPGWRSQYPLSAQTTGRLAFSSNYPLGISLTSGLTSDGTNLLAAEGDLFKVDPRGKRLWIRTPEEKEFFFYYTSLTPIFGAASSVESLNPADRRLVRVLYTQDAAIPNAVQIEVMNPPARSGRTQRSSPLK